MWIVALLFLINPFLLVESTHPSKYPLIDLKTVPTLKFGNLDNVGIGLLHNMFMVARGKDGV